MANHFDVVPVWAYDECGIVVRLVVRAQTRRTIVFAASGQRRAIKRVDLLAILSDEGDVKMGWLFDGLKQTQRSRSLGVQFDTVRRRPFRTRSQAKRFERFQKKRFARCVVADTEFDVIEHDFS